MKKLLIALSAATLLLTACQKEASTEDPNSTPGGGNGGGGGGNNGTKLTRMGIRSGNDSITANYTYNGANALTLIAYNGTANGTPIELQQKFNRNASNIITSYVLKTPLLLLGGFDRDSLVTSVRYNSTTGKYSSSVSSYVYMGQTVTDSTAFNYDGSGKLTSSVAYVNEGSGYMQSTKEEYTYNGSNLASVKSYYDVGNGWELDQTTSYEYDTKVNPMQFAADAPVLGMSEYFSANNTTKSTTVVVDPASTEVTTLTYTYNTNNRPTKSVGTSGGASSTVSYYYQ